MAYCLSVTMFSLRICKNAFFDLKEAVHHGQPPFFYSRVAQRTARKPLTFETSVRAGARLLGFPHGEKLKRQNQGILYGSAAQRQCARLSPGRYGSDSRQSRFVPFSVRHGDGLQNHRAGSDSLTELAVPCLGPRKGESKRNPDWTMIQTSRI